MAGDGASHEEIWDDSALLNSWDDALAEYKKYHSLAAKGETVDLSKLKEAQQANVPIDVQQQQQQQQQQPHSNEAVNATVEHSQTVAGTAPTTQQSTAAAAAPAAPIAASSAPVSAAQPGAGAMPQALLNSVQDEGLKNLIMSWYYAGYYTGLLEGQQKAYASMQESGV
ncbi:hypothetical protein Q7P36_010353 [Cladosporium allicinum]